MPVQVSHEDRVNPHRLRPVLGWYRLAWIQETRGQYRHAGVPLFEVHPGALEMADLISHLRHRQLSTEETSTDPTLAMLVERPELVSVIADKAIPLLLCQLQALQAPLIARLLKMRPLAAQSSLTAQNDRLLSPDEAAQRIGVTVRWLYRHAKQLPFARKLSRKSLRFSEAGLLRWVEKQRP